MVISFNTQKTMYKKYYNPYINSYGLMEALDTCVHGWLSVNGTYYGYVSATYDSCIYLICFLYLLCYSCIYNTNP